MNTISILKQSLTQSHNTSEYARRRDAHPALTPYATPDDVLVALAKSSPLDHPARDAIVLALITEHQRGGERPHPLWQSLLLVAYGGMLGNVRRRILGGERDENAQCTLLAFLEAVSKVPLGHPPSYLSLHLRHATERGAFSSAGRHDGLDLVGMEEAAEELDPRDLLEPLEKTNQMEAVIEELRALFGGEDDAREALDVLLNARTGKEQLEEHIETTYPEVPRRERAALYTRLQRMRARALARLDKRFGRGFTDRALASA